MIIIFSIITCIIIAIFTISIVYELELLQILSGILGGIGLVIMWLGLGLSLTDSSEEVLLENVTVTKSEYVVYVENDGTLIKTFDTKKAYDEIDSTSQIWVHKEYNMYSGLISHGYYYKNE